MTLEVTFIDTKGDTPDELAPRPAKDLLPEWWRTLSASWGEAETAADRRRLQTVKRCVPMLDMLTSGYLLVTPTDVQVSERDDMLWYEWASGEQSIDFHPVAQAVGHPSSGEHQAIPKWIHPWAIRTPSGYSTLFITPPHRPVPFRIFEAVVDTDTYNDVVAFPFMVTDGFRGLIPAGTPMVLALPFRRDGFTHRITTDDERTRRTRSLLFSSFVGGYRNRFWSRKRYD